MAYHNEHNIMCVVVETAHTIYKTHTHTHTHTHQPKTYLDGRVLATELATTARSSSSSLGFSSVVMMIFYNIIYNIIYFEGKIVVSMLVWRVT
jgi:hypothetical protein